MEAAQRAAQTRRERRAEVTAGTQPQPAAERPTQGHVTRRSRPRTHPDLLTVAIRGEFAARTRALADNHGMSVANLLKDALLAYEGGLEAGYEPSTNLRRWQERAAKDEGQAGRILGSEVLRR